MASRAVRQMPISTPRRRYPRSGTSTGYPADRPALPARPARPARPDRLSSDSLRLVRGLAGYFEERFQIGQKAGPSAADGFQHGTSGIEVVMNDGELDHLPDVLP